MTAQDETAKPHPVRLADRLRQASDAASSAATLRDLAGDDAVTVRAALALNPAAPARVQLRLAQDPDERVRLLIARKLASALPDLSGAALAETRNQVIAILALLVRDEAVRIRAAIAGLLAPQAGVPRAIILALAHDREIQVSEPILRLSPLLSADDLIRLLAAPPHSQTAAAIACRANLPASVARLIAAKANDPAIRQSLGDPSAALRESTLDGLISGAGETARETAARTPSPQLPEQATRALSEILAGQVLGELAARPDLPKAALGVVERGLESRAWQVPQSAIPPAPHAAAPARPGAHPEQALCDALRDGDEAQAIAILAAASGIDRACLERAAALRDAKGLMSVSWRAGFSARTATSVQGVIGHLPPSSILQPAETGGYPLTTEEMAWHLDFLAAQH